LLKLVRYGTKSGNLLSIILKTLNFFYKYTRNDMNPEDDKNRLLKQF